MDRIKQIEADPKADLKPVKIAVVRNFTVEPMLPYLRLFCLERGFKPEILVGGFDASVGEILDANGALYGCGADVVFFALNLELLSAKLTRAFLGLSESEREEESKRVIGFVASLLSGFRARSATQIAVLGFEPNAYPALGLLDATHALSESKAVRRLNDEVRDLVAQLRDACFVDLEKIAMRLGWERFRDERNWYLAKAPFAREAWQEIARELASCVTALKGRARKCLILDCDQTLWGGTIGEDSAAALQIGKTYPGSAYGDFQKAVLELHRRGVILAINSKNNADEVLEFMRTSPDMILREEHFAALRINWTDKASNIKSLSDELGIAPEHMVFVDDSPFERQMVRDLVPEVAVIDLPADPSLYARTLRACGHFDTLAFSEEDQKRGSMYRSEALRKSARAAFTDVTSYYQSIAMEVQISWADKFLLPRLSQLSQRSNQFNLTMSRYGETDLAKLISDKADYDVLGLSLTDKFGDYGTVGLAVLCTLERTSRIEAFLLSCRALGRGVEDVLLGVLAETAKSRGSLILEGRFVAGPKNASAANFYETKGFRKTGSKGDADTFQTDVADFLSKGMPAHFAKISVSKRGGNGSES